MSEATSQPGGGSDRAARERVRAALTALVGERGLAGTTLDGVLARAGVERAEFDRLFPSFEACLTEAWKECAADFIARIEAAFARGDGWREGMRRQAWELCRYIVEDQDRTRFLIEISLAEELAQANRDVVMNRCADFVHLGRDKREGADIPRDRADALVGAFWEGVGAYLKAGTLDDLPEGVPQMLYLTMLTYLGPEAAQEELRRGPEDLARYRRGEL